MTSEIQPQDDRVQPEQERTPAELKEARLRSYRQLATGLIIQNSRYLGTFDIDDMTPKAFAEWTRLALQLNSEVDGQDIDAMVERRRRYLETIQRDE